MTARARTAAAPNASAFRATAAFIAVYAAIGLALLPFAREPGPEMPGFNAAFSAGVFVAELATSFLLLIRFRQTLKVSVLLLANAYLFSALMAIAYLLAYPGAMTTARPLIGTQQTISWVYNGWISGFGLLALVAIAVEVRSGNAQIAGARPRAIAAASSMTVLAAVAALVATAILLGDRLPMLSADGGWTSLNAAVNYGAVILFAIATTVILAALRTRGDLFLWLALALAAITFGNALSALGGGRYTVGWYACRLSWAASSCVLLLYFMAQFVRQHGLLVRTTDDLEDIGVIPGQERATDAIELAVGIERFGAFVEADGVIGGGEQNPRLFAPGGFGFGCSTLSENQ